MVQFLDGHPLIPEGTHSVCCKMSWSLDGLLKVRLDCWVHLASFHKETTQLGPEMDQAVDIQVYKTYG